MKQLILFFILISNILKADALPEYTLKAAYLYNFALLTDWPNKQQTGDFNICFYKEDLGEASSALENKKFHDKKIKILTLLSYNKADKCQVIYIRKKEGKNAKELIQKLFGKPILFVSENPKITDSHITILPKGRKLTFDVNLKTFKESDLLVSSRLLKLARKVEQ
jgi:hypothetical protein